MAYPGSRRCSSSDGYRIRDGRAMPQVTPRTMSSHPIRQSGHQTCDRAYRHGHWMTMLSSELQEVALVRGDDLRNPMG